MRCAAVCPLLFTNSFADYFLVFQSVLLENVTEVIYCFKFIIGSSDHGGCNKLNCFPLHTGSSFCPMGSVLWNLQLKLFKILERCAANHTTSPFSLCRKLCLANGLMTMTEQWEWKRERKVMAKIYLKGVLMNFCPSHPLTIRSWPQYFLLIPIVAVEGLKTD